MSEKTKINEKEAGMGPIFTITVLSFVSDNLTSNIMVAHDKLE